MKCVRCNEEIGAEDAACTKHGWVCVACVTELLEEEDEGETPGVLDG